MKTILICTIARDVAPHLCTWWSQIGSLRRHLGNSYHIALSVVENDSKDDTPYILRDYYDWTKRDRSGLSNFWLTTDKLGTNKYSSIWNIDRMRNLAAARQRCLDQVGDFLSQVDKVVYIEPDVSYDVLWCQELVRARHPLSAGLGEPDIYSGWSLRTLSNPRESVFLYDTCATRQLPSHISWDFERAARVEGGWVNDSLIKTYFSDIDANCLHKIWSTFNCFCVYNAAPFKSGLRWNYVNKRLDNGQPYLDDGWLEADTVAICEDFRASGYDKIFLNTNCLVRHI